MKQTVTKQLRRLTGAHGLPLVVLAILGFVSALPGWANAQSETPTTFTSPLPGPGHHHGGPNDELLDTIVDREAILAEALGITVEELAAAREAGVSVHELIDQAGLDEATVRTEIQTAITEAVQQAVTDGVITQEQADALLNPLTPPQHDDAQGPGGHKGGHEGQDGPHQHPAPEDGTPAPPAATPDATTTAEATATPDATTVANAVAESTATPQPDEPRRPRHDHAGDANQGGERNPANDDNATTTTDSVNTATDATSTDTTNTDTNNNEDDQASNNEQPAGAPPNQGGGHRRGGR